MLRHPCLLRCRRHRKHSLSQKVLGPPRSLPSVLRMPPSSRTPIAPRLRTCGSRFMALPGRDPTTFIRARATISPTRGISCAQAKCKWSFKAPNRQSASRILLHPAAPPLLQTALPRPARIRRPCTSSLAVFPLIAIRATPQRTSLCTFSFQQGKSTGSAQNTIRKMVGCSCFTRCK